MVLGRFYLEQTCLLFMLTFATRRWVHSCLQTLEGLATLPKKKKKKRIAVLTQHGLLVPRQRKHA